MGKKRDKEIQRLISEVVKFIADKEIRCITVDKSGVVFANTVDPLLMKNLNSIWGASRSYPSKPIGYVKKFKGDGWKKHIYDPNGSLYITEKG